MNQQSNGYREPKVFIGKVAFYHHEQYGDKIKLSLNRDDIKLLIDRIGSGDKVTVLMHTNKMGKWYGEIDTWRPQPRQGQIGFPQPPPQAQQRYGEDDLPPAMDKDGIPF